MMMSVESSLDCYLRTTRDAIDARRRLVGAHDDERYHECCAAIQCTRLAMDAYERHVLMRRRHRRATALHVPALPFTHEYVTRILQI